MAMPEGFLKSRFPVCGFQTLSILTANDKDFSLALEMTARGFAVPRNPYRPRATIFQKVLDKSTMDGYTNMRNLRAARWCSGLTCRPVTAEIVSSNLIRVATFICLGSSVGRAKD